MNIKHGKLILPWAVVLGLSCGPPAPPVTPVAVKKPPRGRPWVMHWGGQGPARIVGVTADAKGRVVAVGWFRGQVRFGRHALKTAGGDDLFVARLDASGHITRVTTAGGAGNERVVSHAVDRQDNVYLLGQFTDRVRLGAVTLSASGDALFLARMNPAGVISGARVLAGVLQPARIVSSGAGVVMLAGNFNGEFDLDGQLAAVPEGSTGGAFVARLDSKLRAEWIMPVLSTKRAQLQAAALDSQGDAVITGNFKDRAELGELSETSKGGNDIFLAKVDSLGQPQWLQSIGGTGHETSRLVLVDQFREIHVVGRISAKLKVDKKQLWWRGGSDVLTFKTDRQGRVIWAHSFGSVGHDMASAAALDGEGNLLVAANFTHEIKLGSVKLKSSGEADLMVAEINGHGAVAWSAQASGDQPDTLAYTPLTDINKSIEYAEMVTGLAVLPGGDLLVAGDYMGTLKLGRRQLVSRGGRDLFLWRLDRDREGQVHQ